VRKQPVWVDVVLRTALYALGVLVVVILEKGFEGRHEHGGITTAIRSALRGNTLQHMLATTLCVTGGLFSFNILTVIRQHLGPGGLAKLFTSRRCA
jgi:hypothetical protein